MSVPVPGMSAGLFVPATMRIVVVMIMTVLSVAFVVMTAAPRRVVAMIVLFGFRVGAGAEFRFHGSMPDTVLARQPLLDGTHRRVRVGSIGQAGVQRRHIALSIHRPDVHVMNLAQIGDVRHKIRRDRVAVHGFRHALQ